jgi:hypothetical protein
MIEESIYAEMDKECVDLCKAINALPGIKTRESCCGHGKEPFRIWLSISDLTYLPILLYYLDPCHVGFRWSCKVRTDCAMQPAYFFIESEEAGSVAYSQAGLIAAEIGYFLGDAEALEEFRTSRSDFVGNEEESG